MMRVILVILLLAGGCVNLDPQVDPTQFYVLEAPQDDSRVEGVTQGLSIGLKRLRLAEYLEGPRIAVRRGAHRVTYAEFHRWSEGLERGIARSLATTLAVRGPFRRVDVVPWPTHAHHDYLVQVDVQRFEGHAEEPGIAAFQPGEAHLLATWEIIRSGDREVLARGTTDHRVEGWTADDYEELVAMLAETIDALATDVAAGFRGLPPAVER